MFYDYLSEFVTVAQEGSLSGAAQALSVSQPSLGRHMSSLETELGAKLMERLPSGVRLTDAGRTALAAAMDIDALERSVVRHFSDAGARRRQRHLIVSLPQECAALAPAFARAGEATDGDGAVRVHLTWSDASARVLEPLVRGTADVVVAFSDDADEARRDASVLCAPLASLPGAVALEPSHPLARRGDVRVADLRDLCFAHAEGGEARHREATPWAEFEQACEQAGFVPRTRATRYDGRLGIEVRHADDAILTTAAGPEAETLRLAGKALVPVRDFPIEAFAVWRADDPAARGLVERAAAIAREGAAHAAVSQQTLYASASRDDVPMAPLDPSDRARIYERVVDEPPVTEDLVLPDGTVVDKAYVALRNRLNRIGNGLSNDPVATSYQAIMNMWSVEEARAELEMPLMEWFTAYDYSATSGHDLAWCEEMLERLARRCLVYRVVRGGTRYYCLLGWIYGIWEMSVGHYGGRFERWGITGSDAGSGSQFPVMHACPVSADVVRGGTVVAYRDWQGYIGRQSLVCLSPCQCRKNDQELGVRACSDDEHPTEVCLTFGEMARFWLDNGLGREISPQDALAIGRRAVFDDGLVPQLYFSKHPEVMCFCHSDCCHVLAAVRAAGGSATSMGNLSAYRLTCEPTRCVQCGACSERCPMGAIDGGAAGFCAPNAACVGCGQCVLVCPTRARVLEAKPADEVCPLPDDLPESYRWSATDRMARGHISDFTGTRLDE